MFREIVRAQLSRRSVLRGAGGVGVAAALAACGTGGDDAAGDASPTPAVKDKSATDKVVRWANWPAYLDYDEDTKKYPTLEKFQKETGIKATYAEDIDDNDSYYGKIQGQLKNGDDIGKDVIVFTDWMAGRLIRQGYVQKLDKANIPNAKNLNAKLQDVDFDPGREHSLTWQSGYAGIGYRKDKVGRELKTLEDLWAPDLKGKVVVLSEMRDTVGLIMLAQGVDISKDFTEDDFNKGLDELQKQVDSGQIRQVKGNSYLEDLRSGNAIAVHRLVRRHPARPVRGGGRQLHVHPPGVRRHAVVGQPDGADRLAAQDQRREAHRLLLRPGDRGRGRGVRELHLPGRRRPGGDGEDRPVPGREPADLPDRGGPGERQGVPQPDAGRGDRRTTRPFQKVIGN